MNPSKIPRNLTRGQFVKLSAAVAGGAAGAYALFQLAPWMDDRAPAKRVRLPMRSGTAGNDQSRELIRYATLAASGHNAQPWQFLVTGSEIQIRPDSARRLAAVDPEERELWMSLGCALENLTLAARHSGFESEITYPDAYDFIRIKLLPAKAESGAHFSAIPLRQNTRSAYDGRKLGASLLGEIAAIPLEKGISLRVCESSSDLAQVIEYVNQGNRIQFADQAFMAELVQWIRFDKREALASLDGLYSRCSGSPQVPRWVGQAFVNGTAPEKQADSDAAKLRSSAGAIAIASDTEDRAAWVRTGQIYQRLALRMTSLNVKSAFLNQPCEVPQIREQFQSALGFGDQLPQLLVRFGYANVMPSSLRRPVEDVTSWA